jgi:hypothetical protein
MISVDEDLCSYYILYEACQLSILHDDSIQFNSIEFEDWSDSRVHKVPPICMLGIVYNNFQQPDPSCLAPFKYSFYLGFSFSVYMSLFYVLFWDSLSYFAKVDI